MEMSAHSYEPIALDSGRSPLFIDWQLWAGSGFIDAKGRERSFAVATIRDRLSGTFDRAKDLHRGYQVFIRNVVRLLCQGSTAAQSAFL
jgi:hypothetical protein